MAGAATVEKALDVLFHLHEARSALGLSEIGRALDLPKSSCHRLLTSLVNRELVDRNELGHYRPGLALLSLGIGAQGREPVVVAARPILEAEVTELGETVFVVGRRRGRLRVLDKLEGTGFLRAAPGIGDVIPSDVTAVGKLYRVFGDHADYTRYTRHTNHAGISAESTVAHDPIEEDEVRRCGYALNRDAWIDGLSVLAVPIWQQEGESARRLVATLALAAATPRFDALGREAISRRLLSASDRIAGRLGVARSSRPWVGRQNESGEKRR
jgi:DNA-binding IclR family transcriptional regulator